MKTVAFAGVAAVTMGLFAFGEAEPWNKEARQKFADQRFGIFIHWGLYSNYAQGEWYLKVLSVEVRRGGVGEALPRGGREVRDDHVAPP